MPSFLFRYWNLILCCGVIVMNPKGKNNAKIVLFRITCPRYVTFGWLCIERESSRQSTRRVPHGNSCTRCILTDPNWTNRSCSIHPSCGLPCHDPRKRFIRSTRTIFTQRAVGWYVLVWFRGPMDSSQHKRGLGRSAAQPGWIYTENNMVE
jgi:hypothetical protein